MAPVVNEEWRIQPTVAVKVSDQNNTDLRVKSAVRNPNLTQVYWNWNDRRNKKRGCFVGMINPEVGWGVGPGEHSVIVNFLTSISENWCLSEAHDIWKVKSSGDVIFVLIAPFAHPLTNLKRPVPLKGRPM